MKSQNLHVELGPAFSNMYHEDKYHNYSEFLDYKSIMSIYSGLSYEQHLSGIFHLQAGVIYTEKGFKNDEKAINQGSSIITYLKKRVQLNYFVIPLKLKIYNNKSEKVLLPFISFGLYKSFLVGGNYDVEYYDVHIFDRFSDRDNGLLFEGGFIYKNFEFMVGYQLGTSNIRLKNNIESVIKNRTIYISFGSHFDLRDL